MIKKVAYIFIIGCCILVTVGFFRYNPTVIYIDKVPVSAETVVHVNLREIEYNILCSFLKHPFSQLDFESSSTKKREKKESLLDQVEIPNSIFFYTNQQEFKGFLISNEISFKKSFVKTLQEEGFKEQNIKGASFYVKGRVVCVLKENTFQVLCKLDKDAVISPELLASLNSEDYFSNEAPIFDNIKDKEIPIAIATSQGDFFEIIIDEGQLMLRGQLNEESTAFLPFDATPSKGSIAMLSGKLNANLLVDNLGEKAKSSFKKLTSLSLDSITGKWNGALNFNLSSFIEKSDTIVSYEYDDDFNKVEKKQIQHMITPNVVLDIEGKGLCGYLNKKQAIKLVENDSVFTLMPLFTTYVSCKEDVLRLTSVKNQFEKKEAEETNKFLFWFDVAAYQEKERGMYTFQNKYLDKINTIQFSVAKNNEVKATVQLKNTSKNFFFQLSN
ncbi:hypothetical protein [Tenacibaculum caenipelagi]|uniref:Uncharacterized protein n=1 Tax=Tenacibaculum caenipelagi TaxID=1325435 RepID=A0A4V3D365_9FLAO|nr:hypothetical protein [Tenacibaculum caenipelagi]TDQ28394.1 hypothetical protein DFQ07_0764 [Tenacibaculum caenipelagi]